MHRENIIILTSVKLQFRIWTYEVLDMEQYFAGLSWIPLFAHCKYLYLTQKALILNLISQIHQRDG